MKVALDLIWLCGVILARCLHYCVPLLILHEPNCAVHVASLWLRF
jgi:hypothetical protein